MHVALQSIMVAQIRLCGHMHREVSRIGNVVKFYGFRLSVAYIVHPRHPYGESLLTVCVLYILHVSVLCVIPVYLTISFAQQTNHSFKVKLMCLMNVNIQLLKDCT